MSHLAIVNTHPDARLVAVCDSASHVTDVLNRYAVLLAPPPGTTSAAIVQAAAF